MLFSPAPWSSTHPSCSPSCYLSPSYFSFPSLLCLPLSPTLQQENKKIPPLASQRTASLPFKAWPLPTPGSRAEGGVQLLSRTFLRAPFRRLFSLWAFFSTSLPLLFCIFLLEREIKVKGIILSSTHKRRKVRQASSLPSIKMSNLWHMEMSVSLFWHQIEYFSFFESLLLW